MASSSIKNKDIQRGSFQDQSAIWIKLPNGIAIVIIFEFGAYATTKSMEGIFTNILLTYASAEDPDITSFASKVHNDAI